MTLTPVLVLDANILIRAVLGKRVRSLIETYAEHVRFFTPDACVTSAQEYLPDLAIRRGWSVEEGLTLLARVCDWVESAQEYLPDLAIRRGWSVEEGLTLLARVCDWVEIVDNALYADFETSARERMAGRDEDDWPVAAVALALDSPIWTEDRDFFGAGIATWTTDRVELYLKR